MTTAEFVAKVQENGAVFCRNTPAKFVIVIAHSEDDECVAFGMTNDQTRVALAKRLADVAHDAVMAAD